MFRVTTGNLDKRKFSKVGRGIVYSAAIPPENLELVYRRGTRALTREGREL